MVLQEIGGSGYDYVQNTAPSGADSGELWLDTSVTPRQGYVYDGTSWIQEDVIETVLSNLDKPITSLNDLAEGDILSDGTAFAGSNIDANISSRSSHGDTDPNNYLDAPVSNAGRGIDWSTVSWQEDNAYGDAPLFVTGSGYVVEIRASPDTAYNSGDVFRAEIQTDGVQRLNQHLFDGREADDSIWAPVRGPVRFDSSFEVTTSQNNVPIDVMYVLD